MDERSFIKNISESLSRILLSCDETRKVENYYLALPEFNSNRALMKKAAAEAAAIIMHEMPDRNISFSIYAGSGNNGGDGVEIAGILFKSGYTNVRVVRVLPVHQGSDAEGAYQDYAALGGRSISFTGEPESASVVIDALTGIGFHQPINQEQSSAHYGLLKKAVRVINESKSFVFSIDLPSLLSCDSGMPTKDGAVIADITITMFTLKIGFLLGLGRNYTGRIETVLCNLPDFVHTVFNVLDEASSKNKILRRVYIKDVLPFIPVREECAHKGDAGKVFLIGGNQGMNGALMLASASAIRTGSGLVRSCFLSNEFTAMNVFMPEVMTAASYDALKYVEWADVVVIGPGFGRNVNDLKLFENIVKKIISLNIKCLIDADGLWMLKQSELTFHNFNAVLTPHLGEAAMLTGISVSEVQNNPEKVASMISDTYGAVCVLKSATTIIRGTDGNQYAAAGGSPGMASGGMGDMLTGIIAGLLAQGMNPLLGSVAGVLIHGEAGRIEAEHGGCCGMAASDLLRWIRLIRNGLSE